MDQAATEQLSLTAALERLLAIEVDATEARRLSGRLRSASRPPLPPWPVSTLMPPPVWTARSSTSSPPGAIWSRTPTFCWWDSPGTGKTTWRSGLARDAIDAGYRTYFTTAADLAAHCHRAAIEGRWATTMRFYAGPTLLAIELGYLPLSNEAASALFQVVSQRFISATKRWPR